MRYGFYGPVLATEEELRAAAGVHGGSLGLWTQQPWRPTFYVEGRWPVARLARSLSAPGRVRPPLAPIRLLFVVLEETVYDEAEAAELQRCLRAVHPGLIVERGDVRGTDGPPARRLPWILPPA